MSHDTILTRRAALVMAATLASWSSFAQGAESVAPPKELRIGFQKGSLNLVLLKLQGTLEKRWPSTKIHWVEFPAGPQLLEALAVGSVDFGATGDSPPVFAQAAGKTLVYVGAEPPKPDASAILVKPESPLKTLADLKGRKIALQRGSSAHFLTVRAVEKAGLAWSDITPVYLAPADARAAFERGSVDAWAIWDPYYAAAEVAGRTRVLATSRGLTNNNTVYLASPAFASQPGVIKALFDALTEAEAWSRSNRRDTAQQVADYAGLDLATVHRFLERRPASPVGPITPQIAAEQQRVADAFYKLQLIPRQIRVADIVWQPAAAQLAQTSR